MSDKSGLYFATSGIRGKTNINITPDFGLKVGSAFSSWVFSHYNLKPIVDRPTVYVGYDNRRFSKRLADIIIAQVTAAGIDVITFSEPIPTPVLIHSIVHNKSYGGIMVTGSHLPPEDNGIIAFDNIGNYYKGWMRLKEPILVPWENLGEVKLSTHEIDDYFTFLSKIGEDLKINKTELRVLIDPVHGPMKTYVEYVVKQFTDDIVYYNWEHDDTFPGRISEPHRKNLGKTRQAVVDNNCDLGIATDMDGDRVIFIDKYGEVVTGDYTAALFSKLIWTIYPETKIVVPINTSAIVNIVAEKMNAEMVYCKVGPPSIIEKIRETNSKYGFEETGKYMFNDYAIWPDAAISTLYMFHLLQSENKTLSELVATLPKIYSLKEKVACPRSRAPQVMNKVREKLLNDFDNIDNIMDWDGLRFNFSDNSWIMIRPSGTEDYIRVFVEHSQKEKTKEYRDYGIKTVEEELAKLDLK